MMQNQSGFVSPCNPRALAKNVVKALLEMRMGRWVFVALLSGCVFANPALSADFQLLSTSPTLNPAEGECNIQLSGVIQPGDADALEAQLNKINFDGELTDSSVCLDSPGGNYLEGVKIAKLMMGWGTASVVADGAICESACAVAFMGGSRSNEAGSYIHRFLHVNGRLGFHAPYPRLEDGRYSKEDIDSAYSTALQSVSVIMDLVMLGRREVGGKIFSQVKPGLIKEMLKKGRNEFYYIDTVGRAGLWHIDLIGARLQGKPAKNNLINACENFFHWRIWDANEARDLKGIFPKTDYKGDGGNGTLKFDMQVGEYEEVTCLIVPPNGSFEPNIRVKFGEQEFDLSVESLFSPTTPLSILR